MKEMSGKGEPGKVAIGRNGTNQKRGTDKYNQRWKMSSLIHTNQMEYQSAIYSNLPAILQLFFLVFSISYAWKIGYSNERGPKAHT